MSVREINMETEIQYRKKEIEWSSERNKIEKAKK